MDTFPKKKRMRTDEDAKKKITKKKNAAKPSWLSLVLVAVVISLYIAQLDESLFIFKWRLRGVNFAKAIMEMGMVVESHMINSSLELRKIIMYVKLHANPQLFFFLFLEQLFLSIVQSKLYYTIINVFSNRWFSECLGFCIEVGIFYSYHTR